MSSRYPRTNRPDTAFSPSSSLSLALTALVEVGVASGVGNSGGWIPGAGGGRSEDRFLSMEAGGVTNTDERGSLFVGVATERAIALWARRFSPDEGTASSSTLIRERERWKRRRGRR